MKKYRAKLQLVLDNERIRRDIVNHACKCSGDIMNILNSDLFSIVERILEYDVKINKAFIMRRLKICKFVITKTCPSIEVYMEYRLQEELMKYL